MSTFTIALLTFREASRRKILLAALLLGLLFLIVFGLGFHYITIEMENDFQGGGLVQLNEIRNFLLMAGMYVVNFLTAIMTVLTSVDTLSGEISTGTIHTVLSKPIRRWEVVFRQVAGLCRDDHTLSVADGRRSDGFYFPAFRLHRPASNPSVGIDLVE